MALAACELTWLKHFMIELGIDVSASMEMFCDNQAAIHIAANPVFHERTKLIYKKKEMKEVDCHFIRDKVTSGEITTP